MAKLYRVEGSRSWYGEYQASNGGRVRRSTRTQNKAAAQKVLQRWITEDQDVANGLRAGADSRPLRTHLAEYQTAQSLKNRVDTSGETTDEDARRWLDRLVEEFRWQTLSDISAQHIEEYAAFLRKIGRSNRTIQKMIAAVRAFCRWCVLRGRLANDPTQSVAKPSPSEDRRLTRRMLTREEWAALKTWLLSADAPRRNGQPAAERMLMYWTAIETGLRSNEIRTLCKDAIEGEEETCLVVKAKIAKNAKAARQFVSDALAEQLRLHTRGRKRAELVFSVASRHEMARVLRDDANAAREFAGIEDTDFLAGKDSSGKVIDFHALRHTCGAWYVIAGLTLPEVQQTMRHSTISLTIDCYGHLSPDAASRNRNALGL